MMKFAVCLTNVTKWVRHFSGCETSEKPSHECSGAHRRISRNTLLLAISKASPAMHRARNELVLSKVPFSQLLVQGENTHERRRGQSGQRRNGAPQSGRKPGVVLAHRTDGWKSTGLIHSEAKGTESIQKPPANPHAFAGSLDDRTQLFKALCWIESFPQLQPDTITSGFSGIPVIFDGTWMFHSHLATSWHGKCYASLPSHAFCLRSWWHKHAMARVTWIHPPALSFIS